MPKTYYDKDADPKPLQGKRVAVLGYGSQGHAQALNLKDSGIDVVVGLYEGSRSWARAEAAGLEVRPAADACDGADVVQILLPDEVQRRVYEEAVRPSLSSGKAVGFSHGFNVHFGQIDPPEGVDVFMVAPKSPGHMVRRFYLSGQGVPALLAVHRGGDRAKRLGLAYARAIGCTRAGVFETTFKEETETDLFGEQVILCGGVTSLVTAAFETLVEAGYSPEAAYFECCHELKLIVDMINEGGLQWMRYSISDTAEFGDYTRGPRIVTDETKAEMRRVLGEIQRGEFAREWILENMAGRPKFKALRRRAEAHPIEEVGERLRSVMPWLEAARREKMEAKGLVPPSRKAASAPTVARAKPKAAPRKGKAKGKRR